MLIYKDIHVPDYLYEALRRYEFEYETHIKNEISSREDWLLSRNGTIEFDIGCVGEDIDNRIVARKSLNEMITEQLEWYGSDDPENKSDEAAALLDILEECCKTVRKHLKT